VSVRRDDEETDRFKRELGARIREAREAAGLDVIAEFARRVDVDRSAITRWETGQGCPDAVNLRAIARATNVSAQWLLEGFAAPSWRETYDRWVATANPPAAARIWLESLPLEGYAPSEDFYDLAFLAFKRNLSVARTLQMGEENRDYDRERRRVSGA